MPVPLPNLTTSNPLRRALTALTITLACLIIPALAAKPPVPLLSLPLEALGYQGVPPHYLLAGDSILTLHFVDDTHLLVTFTTRGLLTRLPDAQETDNDQNVTAVLLELYSGKVLARTTWRERDRGQYLWPLGHGRFILRIRNKLTLLNPLANLADGNAFAEEPFLELHRTIAYISLSPDADLISVESTAPAKPKLAPASTSSSGLIPRTGPPPSQEIQINFFRTIYQTQPNKPESLTVQSSGVVLSPSLIDVPATAAGYLDISKESPGVFLFDFQGHGGKRLELSPFETSCPPRPHFVSPTEFIAFGCRGSDDHQAMAGFNLHGESPWINAFPAPHLFPYLSTAPAAGRFALSRTILNGSYVDVDNLVSEQIIAQEVTVTQTWDGRSVFKLAASPFQRAGQNFDLSPDGLTLAIIHDAKIQAYKLPPLSKKDEAAVKLAATYAPEPTDARITLGGKPSRKNGLPEEKNPEEKAADKSPIPSHPEAATAPVASQTKPVESPVPVPEPNQTVNGDLDPSRRRPPPSLYTSEYPRQKGDPKPSAPD